MKQTDSPYLFGILGALLWLSGCVTETTSHGPADSYLDPDTTENRSGDYSLVANAEFGHICMSGAHLPEQAKQIALARGWIRADDKHLEQAGLARLRKKILSIPGGGGRFVEEQELMAIQAGDKMILLNLERRIAGKETRSTSCAIYANAEYLKTCELVGRQIGKAPGRNQRYPERDAHFIQWQTQIDGKEASIGCSHTPQSAILPYDGTVLSVLIDHTGKAQKTAFRYTKSSLPVSVDSGR